MRRTFPTALALLLGLFAGPAGAAELILPQNRSAFYSSEPIEFAVAGLAKGKSATLALVPQGKGAQPLSFRLDGDGSTLLAVLPAHALAPSAYVLRLDGKDAHKITVSSGVNVSTMLLSQTVSDPRTAGGNFFLGNAFSFGLLDRVGRPRLDLRNGRSGGMQAFDNAVRDNLPTVVYMYWTGYVTHKPFGSEKSWAAKDMMEATRLLSFHTAQRLRRYGPNVHMVGALDEPGLSWGKTPAGGMASGFPNWDEADWYSARGWKYTQGPAARPAEDWMKYLTVRCGIMKEMNAQAKKDLKTVWPGLVFSTDLYAPHAVMDGTDPLNQEVNDVPSSHVFVDWGTSRAGALSGLYLEKAHNPTLPIAHAMNGQLFAETVPQPHQSNAYRVTLNAMLAAGLYSNWWLNPTGMKEADLAAINEPGLRVGPLFRQFRPAGHDVAVLWSFTEIGMRQKDTCAREAKKKTGEQIKLLIASMPDVPGAKDKEVEVNAYNVGGNYKEQVLNAHQALVRAGYPAHVLHERVLGDQLKNYKTLVVVGQTFELPKEVRKTIDDWVAKGGTVVVDGTTKAKLPGAVLTKADFRDPGFRWSAFFTKAERKDHPFKSNREASYYLTNYFMEEMVRAAVGPMKDAMKKTKSRPAAVTDSTHLLIEKHVAGKGALYLVLNAHEKLPTIPADKRHYLYNYAAHKATFVLQGIQPGSVVYCIEGADWKKVREVKDWDKPQTATFEPGEMKLFLVAPKNLEPLRLSATPVPSGVRVEAVLESEARTCPHPWPLALTVTGPDGKELYRAHRSTDWRGGYEEVFPLGANASPGRYTVLAESPAGALKATKQFEWKPPAPKLTTLPGRVRVFDETTLRTFLGGKPEVVIATGNEGQKGLAEKLAADLKARGIQATIKPEGEVFRKVAYPRVWSPYATVYSASRPQKRPKDMKVKSEIAVGVAKDGTFTARTKDGKDVRDDWRLPNALVTIGGDGFVDFGGDRELCYEPGVKLYFNDKRQLTVVKGEAKEAKTTKEFRARWARPWARLTSHVGAYQLPAQLPEAWTTDRHLILLGDSKSGTAVAALQASELLPQVADGKYPGAGKALVSFAWSPFGVERNVVLIGASDKVGLEAGIARLVELVPRGK